MDTTSCGFFVAFPPRFDPLIFPHLSAYSRHRVQQIYGGIYSMASFRKRGNNWEVFVARRGVRQSATFATKAEASAWATQLESEILSGRAGKVRPVTFADLLTEYAEKVSPTKRGQRWEVLRLAKIGKDAIGKVRLPDLAASDFAAWRDRRLAEVTPASVRREWNLLSAAINVAINEWGWLTTNPMTQVKRPASPPPRDRRISDSEIEALLVACGYDRETPPETAQARVGSALLFAIETALRAGEIVGLKPDDIDREKRVATIRAAKTHAGLRRVPLSTEAMRLIDQLAGTHDRESVFGIDNATLDALWRKARDRADITDLHFHDSRAEAITRLARRLDILSLARMVGHRDLKMLQVYYRESPEDMVHRLD